MTEQKFFVFDVESIGLHGEAFAVAGCICSAFETEWEFFYSCPANRAEGVDSDRKWIGENVPALPVTHAQPLEIRNAFWTAWTFAKAKYPDIVMAGECGWPVEARFLCACIDDEPDKRRWEGPYPLHEIATYMRAAGMDPMAKYPRTEDELPEHNPICDVRQSVRLLGMALEKVGGGFNLA